MYTFIKIEKETKKTITSNNNNNNPNKKKKTKKKSAVNQSRGVGGLGVRSGLGLDQDTPYVHYIRQPRPVYPRPFWPPLAAFLQHPQAAVLPPRTPSKLIQQSPHHNVQKKVCGF